MTPSMHPPGRPGSDDSAEDGGGETAPGTPANGWKRALRWAERVVWVGVLIFIAVRLGPQLGALLGVGPTLGSVPEFQVETLDGGSLGLADLEGRVAVVNFWATWCPPCRVEIPALQSLHEDLAGEGVLVLGLSTDAGGIAGVREFLEERGVTYPVAMANADSRRAFGGVTALPTTFILDRDGVVRHRVFGFFAPPAMRAAVRRLLDEDPAPEQ
ncbi:MAG: TlpA disulfide reductase family protein [Gemmatimonadota bacterium]